MRKAQQEAIRERLRELIERAGGVLTPRAVVSDAAASDSPLHASFEWDEGKAADGFRLDQARNLIRSCEVQIRVQRTVVTSVAYVRDPAAGARHQGYRAVTELRTDKDAARAAICDEFSAVADRLRRARELSKVLGVQEDVEGLLASVVTLQRRFEQPPPTQQM